MGDEQEPRVGTHATIHYPDDKYGAVVTGMDDDLPAGGRRLTLTMLRAVSVDTGHEPAQRPGGYPVWSHVYTDEEVRTLLTDEHEGALPNGDGRWVTSDGALVTFGQAYYWRNMGN